MPLLLTSTTAIEGGSPRELPLDGRDVVIGRSDDADWTLPDPTQQVSSRHCRVVFRDGSYLLTDLSTNGTMLNGVRLAAPQPLKAGDRIGIGHYVISVTAQAATVQPSGRMDLNSWDRAKPNTSVPPAAPSPPSATSPAETLEHSLAHGLAVLVATRARQRRELGVTAADPLSGNPLAGGPDQAAALLARAPAPQAAVAATVDAVERHHAATLRATQEAFRGTLARFSPDAIARDAKPPTGTGDARDAALWRAYVARFSGAEQEVQGFTEAFATAFRQAHERLAEPGTGGPKPNSAPRPRT